MKINAKFIRTLKPCEDGILDFEAKHPNFNGKLSELLALDDISYCNKVWLASKVANLKTLQIWSVECAEFVLDNFEKEFPNDKRVRECLEITKKVIIGELHKSAGWSAARSAAKSVARSAWSAAWSAWSVAESEARSAVESAVESAESAVESAESEKEQEDINLSILIALLENEGM